MVTSVQSRCSCKVRAPWNARDEYSAGRDQHIGSVFTADKSIALRVVEPLDLALHFVSAHPPERHLGWQLRGHRKADFYADIKALENPIRV